MATSAGELEYTVSVSTSGMLTGVKVVQKGADDMRNSLYGAEDGTRKLETQTLS